MSDPGPTTTCTEILRDRLLRRCYFVCVAWQNKIVIHGGLPTNKQNGLPLNSLALYDIDTNAVSLLDKSGPSLSHHSGCVQGNILLLVGGWDGRHRSHLVHAFNLEEGTWINMEHLEDKSRPPTGLSGHTATLINPNLLCVLGREGGIKIQRKFGDVFLLHLDLERKVYWYSEGPVKTKSRSGHTAVLAPSLRQKIQLGATGVLMSPLSVGLYLRKDKGASLLEFDPWWTSAHQHRMAQQNCKDTAKIIVYNHLLKITPNIAHRFRTNHHVPEERFAKVTLDDIVDKFHLSKYNELVNGLVHTHLVQVAPDLANQFEAKNIIGRSTSKLQQVEQLSNRRITDKFPDDKPVNNTQHSEKEENDSSISIQKSEPNSSPVILISDEEDDSNFASELERYFPCYQDCSPDSSSFHNDIPIIDISSSSEDDISTIDLKQQTLPNAKDYGQLPNECVNDASEKEICDDDITGYCKILECDAYTNMYRTLIKSKKYFELDKIILFILNQNILVRKIHQIVKTTKINHHNTKKDILDKGILKIGNYNVEEREIIRKNWNFLVASCKIKEPSKVLESLSNLSTRNGHSYEELLKRNVLGMYLSKGLSKVRHASDVFKEALNCLYLLKIQKFKRMSKEENDQITEYVRNKANLGLKCDWKELARLINRPEKYAWNLQNRYKVLQVNEKGKTGTFSFIEDKMILNAIFSHGNFSSVESIPKNENFDSIYEQLALQMGRYVKYVRYHWLTIMKPILLQYHAGTLGMDIKRCLFNYLHEEGVKYLQDIRWDRLLEKSQFAGHSRQSLTLVFINMKNSTIKALGCAVDDVSVADIVKHANTICDPKNTNTNIRISGLRARKKFEIVKYYRSLIEKNV